MLVVSVFDRSSRPTRNAVLLLVLTREVAEGDAEPDEELGLTLPKSGRTACTAKVLDS
jgi:hypothetical protein